MRARLTMLLVCSWCVSTPAQAQYDFDTTVERDLAAWRTGFVVGLHHGGELQFLEAFGTRAEATEVALETTDVFAFPALTELLVSVTVEALHAADIVDATAPLSTLLPDLDPAVGRATLRQLMTHTAGLDNASRIDGETWKKTLDRVDDFALVTEPGTIYSQSRHSLPMAARVLERVVGRPFDQLATSAVLQPLGMTSSTFSLAEARRAGLVEGIERSPDDSSIARLVEPSDTVNGLPVLFTTSGDVLTFLTAWMDSQVRGQGPLEVATQPHPSIEGRSYWGGIWADSFREQPRIYRTSSMFGTAAGFYMLPETRSIVLLWAAGEWPSRVARFVLDRVAESIDAPPDPPRARAQQTSDASASFALPDPGTWAGTYRNGDLIFVLRESGGILVMFDGNRELSLRVIDDDSFVAYISDGRAAVRFHLKRDPLGRRYLYYGNLAYRHLDDDIGD